MDTTAYERRVGLFLDVVSNSYPVEGSDIAGISTAVSVNGKIEHTYAAGTSGIEGEDLDEHTVFRIASISKPITAAAVLLLIEQGKLTLDTGVYDILEPLFKSIPSAGKPGAQVERLRQVTVRDLLRHTSGWNIGHTPFGREPASRGWDPMLNDRDVRARKYGSKNQEHPLPVTKTDIMQVNWAFRDLDTSWSYANVNYLMLGRLIETISGKDYGDFVLNDVLESGDVSGFALGHTRRSERLPRETHYFDSRSARLWDSVMGDPGEVAGPYGRWNVDNMDAHGGWVASPSALVQFADALFFDQSILNGDSVKSIQDERDTQSNYGLGWQVWKDPDREPPNNWRRFHSGLLSGSTSFLMHLPSRDNGNVCYAAVLNTADFSGRKIDGRTLDSQLSAMMYHAVDSLLPGKLKPVPLEAIGEFHSSNPPDTPTLAEVESALET